MERTIFYCPEISANCTLSEDESTHCIKVLRKKEGDLIFITDGKGHFFDTKIIDAHPKRCMVDIINVVDYSKSWNNNVHIAFAPTKNLDRIEWFAEKATEIGIDCLTPLLCRFSERKELKLPRIEKILISAMKQSQKACLPQINPMTSLDEFIKQPFNGQKYIAHCYEQQKELLKKRYQTDRDVLILIGPEGDFSEQEVDSAIRYGFEPISLGNSRLRTETAALFACATIQLLNQH